uniref:Uncharacterized protein n=1 Tax=Oryza glumipatula TaxID=40148 RepID=A0A0E0BGL9_9ORYZ
MDSGGRGCGDEPRGMGVHDGGRGRRRRASTRPPLTSPRHRGLRRQASAWREARTAEDVAAAMSPAWGATAEDVAASDVVAGLLPGAPAPPPAIYGAAVNANLRLHPRGRPVHPPPAPQLHRGPSPVAAFIVGRRSRCESGPSSYPSAASGEQRDKTGCKELVDLVMNRMISDRYQDLIHCKHHPPRGKNRMVPDRYHLIPHKYHLIRGRIA